MKKASFRRLTALLAVLTLLFALHAGAETAQDGDDGSRLLTYAGSFPRELADAFAAAGLGSAVPLQGYAAMRFGQWTDGEAVLQDEQGYLLCGMVWRQDTGWEMTVSRTALRQDAAPTLMPDAVRYNYTDEDVGQMDGCDSFNLVYEDVTYRWGMSMDGWCLWSITHANGESMDIARYTIATGEGNGRRVTFSVQSRLLEDMDIATFPDTFAAAEAAAQASSYADDTRAVLTVPETQQDDGGYGLCRIPLYAEPNAKIAAHAWGMEEAQARVLEVRDGYVRIRLGGENGPEGWIRRENALIGLERAQAWNWDGYYGQIYAQGSQENQPVYAAPGGEGEPIDRWRRGEDVGVLGMSGDRKWLLVQNVTVDEGIYERLAYTDNDADVAGVHYQVAWVSIDAVSQTSNFYDAWVYSEDPALRLNLREKPDKDARSLGKYYSGVRVIQMMPDRQAPEGWVRVAVEGVTGWVQSRYLDDACGYAGGSYLPPLAQVQGAREPGLNLRKGPGGDKEVIAAYPNGTVAEVMGVSGGWAHVRLQDGRSGYMLMEYLGGEPQQAVKNAFTLSADQPLLDGWGDPLEETLAAGETFCIRERPCPQWLMQADRSWTAFTYSCTTTSVEVRVKGSEKYGYLPADVLSVVWQAR